ncbi:MAG: hypothetical protein AAGI09_05295 [Pseudomonadota bacterium]
MTERLFWGGVTLLLVVGVLGVQTLRHGFFTVKLTQGALVLDRKGHVLREANIGLNLRNPFLETVWNIPVTRERRVRIEGLWVSPDCTLDGLVVWQINDLHAYYEAQKTVFVAQRVSDPVSAVAYASPAPFGLEGDAFLDWGLSFQYAVRDRSGITELGGDAGRAYPLAAPCSEIVY